MTQIDKAKQAVASTQIVTVQDFISKKKDLIARVLPKAITPERLLGIFEMILNSSPKLKECSQKSLIGAVIQTAQLGLQPGNIGHIHLIPFNNKGIMECQLIIGYRGYVELVNRSREATILTADVVYEKDQFQYEQGLNPILRHIPVSGDRGERIGVYCIAKNLLANEKVFVYLQKEEIEKIKASSKSAGSDYSPWKTWESEMWKKSAVKRISKLLPLSAESEKAISADETIKTEIKEDMTEVKDVTDWNETPLAIEAKVIPETKVIAEPEKPRPSALDVSIHQMKKTLNDDVLYYNILGKDFGLEHMTELNERQKAQFAEKLAKEVRIKGN